MLRFVLGRNGSGKTEYVRSLLAQKLAAGESGLLLIVPEQFSYETEREMLKKVGAKAMLRLQILSFSRLAENVLEETKPNTRPPITDGMRAVLMSLALEALGEQAEIYQKYKNRTRLLESLVTFSTELKQCALTPADLRETADKLSKGTLRQKLTELSLITQMYDALVHLRFSDDTDLLTVLANTIPETDYFNGKTVVFDAFAGFTKQERSVLAALLPRCADVYVTLCTDADRQNGACIFDNVNDEMRKLQRVAALQNTPVAKPVHLDASKADKTPELKFIEKNLFDCRKSQFPAAPDGIALYSAANRTEECEFVARTIRKLLREENCRARDIAVLQRRKGTYDSALRAAFTKYEVPFFEDRRRPVAAQPIMQLTDSLLDMAANGISTQSLMRYLKTDLAGLTAEETAELENYAVIWSIDGAKWRSDFTENPDGLGATMQTRSEEKLATLNELRRRAVAPILKFRLDFADGNPLEKSERLYRFLIELGVDASLKSCALALLGAGAAAEAQQQNAVWDTLMQILDMLARVPVDGTLTPGRYRELFTVLLESTDLGQIPDGLDTVCIGSADRIRIAPPRFVFVLGANEGVFPENPPTQGVLNDVDRKILLPLGLELTETAEYKAVDERFFAYYALTLPKERLYVSWSMADYQGESMTQSVLVTELQDMFPSLPVTDSQTVPPEDKIEGEASAFEVLADSFSDASALFASLKAYFEEIPAYRARLDALSRAAGEAPVQISDSAVAERLFGRDMLLSASKAECYYKCPFSYFCQFGLGLKAIKKAELDYAQSGTVIHYCLESVLSQYDRETLLSMSESDLRAAVHAAITSYAQEKMGGEESKDPRFVYLLRSLSETVFDVLERLISEFSVSAFIPTDFELSIRPDGAIAPYRLPLPDGGSLRIIGSVDRVDVMQKDGKSYLRVIDYKSSGKEFSLSEVFSGLNMQMLIYLFAICENGSARYGEIVPAGILYLPAKSVEDKLLRDAEKEEIHAARLKNSRMSGVVLHDTDVILGMDSSASGLYIPVTARGESFTGKLLSAKEFSALRQKVDENLCDLGLSLHDGVIPVLPAMHGDKNLACAYCDFAAVCGYEDGDAVRQLPDYGKFDVAKKKLLEKEGEIECASVNGQANS